METTESCAGKQRLDGGQRKRKANGGDDWRDPGTIPSAWRMLTARRSGWRSRLASGTLQSAAIRRRRRRVRGDSTGKRGWLSIRKTGEGDGERGEAGERRRGGPSYPPEPRLRAAQGRSDMAAWATATVATVGKKGVSRKPPWHHFLYLQKGPATNLVI